MAGRNPCHNCVFNNFFRSVRHEPLAIPRTGVRTGSLAQEKKMSLSIPAKLTLRSLTALSAACLTAALTGCGMGVTAGPTNALTPEASFGGHVQGGNQPVGGATVKLYSVGTTDYGKGSTLLATATTSSDGNASFQFSQVSSGATGPTGNKYTCPTSDTLIYLIVSGGNTLNTGTNNNAAAVFLAALGKCGSIGANQYFIDEATSVASIWALQQYINPGTTVPATATIGSPNTTQAKLGLLNAFNTVPNLANWTNGTAQSSVTATGTNTTVNGTIVTLTPETSKLNSIANILASCVNNADNTAANCATLFTNATPPSPAVTSQPTATFSTAVDTLQAAYYMATNPTDGSTTNLGNLFALTSATAPFQPSLATTATPSDWTLGILYSGATACTNTETVPGVFIYYAYQVRVDANGNIWMGSNKSAPANVSEMSPTGTPLGCETYYNGTTSSGLIQEVAIDPSGNAWVAAHSGALYKVNGTSFALSNYTESGLTPAAVTSDATGNIFYSSSGTKPMHEFTSGAAAGATSTIIGGNLMATPLAIAIDKSGNIWSSDTSQNLYETYADSAGTGGYTSYAASVAAGNNQAQIATDASGNVWTTQTTPANTATIFTPATPPATATANATAAGTGGLATPRGVALDGAGNAWIPDGVSAGHITELDKNLNALSPSGSYLKPTFTATMRSAAVDPSGNVWFGTNATTVSLVEEIVGAGVPVVTPLSAQQTTGPAKP